jgi:hypothetical protein
MAVAHLIKNCLVFYGNQSFVTVYKSPQLTAMDTITLSVLRPILTYSYIYILRCLSSSISLHDFGVKFFQITNYFTEYLESIFHHLLVRIGTSSGLIDLGD